MEDIVGGTRGQLAAALAVGPVLRGRLAAQPFRFSNAGDGEWLLANVSAVHHLAKSFIVLCSFVGILAVLVEALKAVFIQHVMAVRKSPAHTRSSCRKQVKFNCWTRLGLHGLVGEILSVAGISSPPVIREGRALFSAQCV